MLSKIDEMQAIFGDAELTRWVLRKPSSEEIDMFYDWRYLSHRFHSHALFFVLGKS